MRRITRAEVSASAGRAWERLRGGALTPLRAAASVGVGLAIGVTPLYGAHLLLVLAVCLPLRLDAPLAYLAANISIPVMAPLLTMAEVEIGAFVLTAHALPMDVSLLRARGAGMLVRELVVGTLVFSPAVALVGAATTFVIARGWQRRRLSTGSPETRAAIDRVATRYARSRAAYHYVRSKLACDPVGVRVVDVGAASPLGDVVDVGCGRGQLGVLLLERGVATSVRGLDWDAAKVKLATEAAHGLPAEFSVQDLRSPLGAACDTVLLIDVLHYLTDDEQDALLHEAARTARRMLVVRDLDPDRGWRSAVTRMQELVTTGFRMNRGARVHVRPIARVVEALTDEGFVTDVSPCWGALPLANVLVVARRPEPA